MDASAKFQELFEKADETGVLESYARDDTEVDQMAVIETGTTAELINVMADMAGFAYHRGDAVAGDLLTALRDVMAQNPDADFSY